MTVFDVDSERVFDRDRDLVSVGVGGIVRVAVSGMESVCERDSVRVRVLVAVVVMVCVSVIVGVSVMVCVSVIVSVPVRVAGKTMKV